MKKIEIRTTKNKSKPIYKQNLDNVIVFLRHSEDRIIIKNNEEINIEIYDNGNLIFIGSKREFYDKLK